MNFLLRLNDDFWSIKVNFRQVIKVESALIFFSHFVYFWFYSILFMSQLTLDSYCRDAVSFRLLVNATFKFYQSPVREFII